MEYRNAKFLKDGGIDCEVNHPVHGWIPTLLRDSDPETAEMFAVVAPEAEPAEPESIEHLAAERRRAINAARNAALNDGMPYTMPDGTDEIVQTRDNDRLNLLGLRIEARDLQAAGVTDAVMEIRVLSNQRYALTAQQMIDVTNAALSHHKSILEQGWELKDQIAEAIAADDRDTLQAIEWPETTSL